MVDARRKELLREFIGINDKDSGHHNPRENPA